MRNLFLIIFVGSFVGQMFGSEYENEVDDKVVFTVGLQQKGLTLLYLGQKKIEAIRKYFPDIKNNEPFFTVSKYVSNTEHVQCLEHDACTVNKERIQKNTDESLQKNLLYLPLRFFLVEKEKKFKPHKAELCSALEHFSEVFWDDIVIPHKYKIAIHLDSPHLSKFPLEQVINCFRDKPNWLSEDEEELIKAHIINEEDGHGLNSYFADEIKEALFYARLKTIVYLSLTAIVVYVLYQKFNTTAR